ncbi:MAG: 2-oxoglutarate dehydrogenase complex dihydrolipoyllysine-residue succinyltransferase [Alphaproteobacteria bacterium]|jgi:2-oxoglutarate dehydrogenase E2 component (dihydrolipoamide succinyltransferase)|nr:MAG: 2-oxoglutarate dehydrogenase complex dihydrolipoyllysine-residue succinyltransferase [Alphaproteobacteria bacterium]
MMIELKVPTLGESVTEATVGTWFKKAGEKVAVDEMICELETDKVTIEVPSTVSGVVSKIIVKEGETVGLDAILALLEEGAGSGEKNGTSNIKTVEKNTPEKIKDHKNAPSAEKIMKEKNIDPSSLKGTGRDGRIMKEDVMSLPSNKDLQVGDMSSPRSEEKVKMTRLRQTIARRLKESQNTAAMLTTYNEADMTAILKIRSELKDQFFSKHGVKLGFMSFFVKACCKALEEVPEVNAQIDGDHIIYKHYVNMGVAVGTDNGLVVPVLKNANNMGFSDIEKEINKMGLLARDGKLSIADMTGGTFTLSNGGIYGSLMSSPILNSPESGILGMHKIQERPMVIDGKIEIRPMMYLALSYDHRIVDGKGAVTFLVRVKENLEDPRRLLIDL